MSVIEYLIEKTKEQRRQEELEQEALRDQRDMKVYQNHEERIEFIKDTMGVIWDELKPYSSVISMNETSTLIQVDAMELELKPFFILCNLITMSDAHEPMSLRFYEKPQWVYNFSHLGILLTNVRSEYSEWKKAQEIEKKKATAKEEYLQEYREWLLCKSREPKPPLNLDVLVIKQIQSQARQEVQESDYDF